MRREPSSLGEAGRMAVICATVMIAAQVAGKATRDALFLSNFDVSDLPTFLIGSSVISILVILGTSQLMSSLGPARLVPAVFVVSAGLHFIEGTLLQTGAARASAVLVFFHVTVLGAILVSAFWSLVNERFDPRAARKRVGRIGLGASLGGLLGGLAAERAAAQAGVSVMLPGLAVFHLVCAWAATWLKPAARQTRGDGAGDALKVLRDEPYLRHMGWLILLTATSAAMVDYVFKAQASRVLTRGEDLLRFFALFYTITGFLTFLVQATLNRVVVQKLGLARTTAALPAVVAVSSAGAAVFPGLLGALTARGLESVVRGSLFRAGYELLYTAIPTRDKRAAKGMVDVGAERVGDMFGAGLTRLILAMIPAVAASVLMGLAAGLAVLAVCAAIWLHRGYVRILERNLVRQAIDLNLDDVRDNATRTIVLKTLTGLRPAAPPAARPGVAWLEEAGDLLSGDPERVNRCLEARRPLPRELVGLVIALLGDGPVQAGAFASLSQVADRSTGELTDALLDRETPPGVKKQLARLLALSDSPRALQGLESGLQDPLFENRYNCVRAMTRLKVRNPGAVFSEAAIYATVRQELAVDLETWRRRGLVEVGGTESGFADESLKSRALVSLEHVFTLLALVLPRKPLHIAFRGIHTDDQTLRGTALEYLESLLPSDIRALLWPLLEGSRAEARLIPRSRSELESELVRSHETIEMNLSAIRARLAEERRLQEGAGGKEP